MTLNGLIWSHFLLRKVFKKADRKRFPVYIVIMETAGIEPATEHIAILISTLID